VIIKNKISKLKYKQNRTSSFYYARLGNSTVKDQVKNKTIAHKWRTMKQWP
jgi:hypothetical protein